MMVPRTSLLIWTGVLAVPAAGWLGWAPGMPPAALLLVWMGGAAIDAWRSRRLLAPCRIRAPSTFRLARGREETLMLRVACATSRTRPLRMALAAAPELGLQQPVQTVILSPGSSEQRVAWRFKPGERGRYRIVHCHLETPSRWGFWNVRGGRPLDVGCFVYPGFLTHRHHAPALFLRRGMAGIRHQRRMGKGREFEQLRDYQAGDSLDDIHWKATAKHGVPITKMYQVERTQEVYVAIDTSRLSGRPATTGAMSDASNGPSAESPDRLIERYVNAALLLGRAAELQGDRFGLLTFNDRLLEFVRARRGPRHTRACLDAVCRLQPSMVTPDFREVFRFIRQHLRRRALVTLLTQLDDPALAETFPRDLDIIRRQHVVLVCTPGDPRIQPLFSRPETVHTTEDIYVALGGHLQWRQRRDLAVALRKRNVGFLTPPDDAMITELITQYVDIKQRQSL